MLKSCLSKKPPYPKSREKNLSASDVSVSRYSYSWSLLLEFLNPISRVGKNEWSLA